MTVYVHPYTMYVVIQITTRLTEIITHDTVKK